MEPCHGCYLENKATYHTLDCLVDVANLLVGSMRHASVPSVAT